MHNDKTKKFCLNLMQADREVEVISILKETGYWGVQACHPMYAVLSPASSSQQ